MDKESILGLIKKLQKEKEDNRIVPTHILEVELFNAINSEIKQAINELYKESKIEVVKTINQNAFKIKIL